MNLFDKVSTRYAISVGAVFFVLVFFGLTFTSKLVFDRLNQLRYELITNYADTYSSSVLHSLKTNANYLSNRLFNPLFDFNISSLNEELQRIENWLQPESIVILDKTGKLVTDGSIDNSDFDKQYPIPDNVESGDTFIMNKDDSRILYFRIGYGEQTIGYARVVLSKDKDLQEVQSLKNAVDLTWKDYVSDFELIILLSILLVFAISLVAAWRLYLLISRPINVMSLAAEQYAAGNLDYALPVNSSDEFGRLAMSLNDMAFKLKDANRMLTRAQEISAFGSWEWHKQTDSLTISHGVYLIFDITPEHFNHSIYDLLSRVVPDDRYELQRTMMGEMGDVIRYDFDLLLKSGVSRKVRLQGEVVKDEDEYIEKARGTLQDVTEQYQAEERLKLLANYDGLTSLPNRNLFYDRLNHAMSKARRNQSQVALLFIDLDRFKSINDALGHAVGDELLKAAAERMKAAVRDSDTLARMGGDEFTIILEDLSENSSPQKIASNILSVLSRPFDVDHRELHISASIGIAIYPSDAEEVDVLIKNADTAMYEAKENGKGQFHFFTPRLDEIAKNKLELEQLLREAIRKKEFVFHFQPQVSSHDSRFLAAEALLRWEVNGKFRPPATFIPVLEESGLIKELTGWAFAEVCKTCLFLEKKGLNDFRLSVNLSASQFQMPDLIVIIDQELKTHGVAPDRIEIEITESTLLDAELSQHNARQLQQRNIRLAIDDFGTGYSSLTYLKQYSVDALKIDQSFVKSIETDPEDLEISSAIISLAKAFNIDCIAEGVETKGQLDLLRDKGCDSIQGYYICRPVNQDELWTWYESTALNLHSARR